MKLQVGKKFLITTDQWLLAPDGEQYKAVFGTVKAINTDEETLGIKTNRGSTNWYVTIGDMAVAGCQLHYVIRANDCNESSPYRHVEHEGKVLHRQESRSNIYFADKGEAMD